MILYAISDRRKLAGGVVGWARGLMAAGVDMLQIREKDLPAADLYRLTQAVLELPNPRGTKILVNSRLDVALAAGADGVHLPSNAIAPSEVRQIALSDFHIGVSCHTAEELRRADAEGADFVVYGPVFEPLSKIRPGKPVGLAGLREACDMVSIPVLALGGVTAQNAIDCQNSGASGIAAISLFLPSEVSARDKFRELKSKP